MAYVKTNDIVLIDELNFDNFMDYRAKRGLATGWGWMHLPAGTMMEVQELIFRTTGSRRTRKTKTDEDGEKTYTRRGRSCWVKCSIVTPLEKLGEEHIIPSWLLKKAVVSHIQAEQNSEEVA
jgi:hypothetical protein